MVPPLGGIDSSIGGGQLVAKISRLDANSVHSTRRLGKLKRC